MSSDVTGVDDAAVLREILGRLDYQLKTRYDTYEVWWDSLAAIFRFASVGGRVHVVQADVVDYRKDQVPVPAPAPRHPIDEVVLELFTAMTAPADPGPAVMVLRYANFEAEPQISVMRGDEAGAWRVTAENWADIAMRLAPAGTPDFGSAGGPTPPIEAVRLWTGTAEDRLRFWMARAYGTDLPADGGINTHVNGAWDWSSGSMKLLSATDGVVLQEFWDPEWIHDLTVDALRDRFSSYTPPLALVTVVDRPRGTLTFHYFDGAEAEWIKSEGTRGTTQAYLKRFDPFGSVGNPDRGVA